MLNEHRETAMEMIITPSKDTTLISFWHDQPLTRAGTELHK